MAIRLDTVLEKVESMPNRFNSDLLKDFYHHMKDNGASQNYQKGNLKAMVHFAEHIGAATSFYDVDHKQIIRFFDTKIKPDQTYADEKWITTWNGKCKDEIYKGGWSDSVIFCLNANIV